MTLLLDIRINNCPIHGVWIGDLALYNLCYILGIHEVIRLDATFIENKTTFRNIGMRM